MTRIISGDDLTTLMQGDKPVVIDFAASWCGPCKAMEPALDALARDLAGRVEVVKVDVDNDSLAAAQFKVRGVPTVVVTLGALELGRTTGAMPAAALKRWVEGVIS